MNRGATAGAAVSRRAGIALAALLVVSGSSCRERGRPDPNVRMAVSHARQTESGGSELGSTVPTQLVVPPEVTQTYSAIRLEWQDSQSSEQGTLEVPIGGGATLPGSNLQVRADVFLPAFTMSSNTITSSGTAEENPAARIAVLEGEKEIFAGWLFTRFPDVHPFQHPRFALRLAGGVARKAA